MYICKYLKERCREDSHALFSGAQSRTGGKGHKLEHRSALNARRHCCGVCVLESWNRLLSHWHLLPE